jgi:hypothetical protein
MIRPIDGAIFTVMVSFEMVMVLPYCGTAIDTDAAMPQATRMPKMGLVIRIVNF